MHFFFVSSPTKLLWSTQAYLLGLQNFSSFCNHCMYLTSWLMKESSKRVDTVLNLRENRSRYLKSRAISRKKSVPWKANYIHHKQHILNLADIRERVFHNKKFLSPTAINRYKEMGAKTMTLKCAQLYWGEKSGDKTYKCLYDSGFSFTKLRPIFGDRIGGGLFLSGATINVENPFQSAETNANATQK